MSENRKLRVIVFADIAGYTALMQQDEEHALSKINHFKSTIESKVPIHQGEIVQYFGDGTLLTFESSIKAVECALAMQLAFVENEVPVRIGAHQGDVVLSKNNVFGDGVNIASRIESVAVPGSILISKQVRDQIKNKPNISLDSMGMMQFKNVEEPMEVFAVSNPGVILPSRKDLNQGPSQSAKGHTHNVPTEAATKSRRPLRVIFTVGGLILAGLLLEPVVTKWMGGGRLVDRFLPSSQEVLTDEIRSKRVAVMVFENQTMSEDLDAFGKMISDWITRGLMETGEANVISAANIAPQIARAGIVDGANPQLVSLSGVDIMVQGRYYLQEEKLSVHSNIVDVNSGKVIHALKRIEGSKSNLPALLNALTQQVLGYWAVRGVGRFSQNPPKYKAWLKYQEGLEAYPNDVPFDVKERLLKEAFALDTNFYAPLLKMHALYNNYGRRDLRDSLNQLLTAKSPSFTKWEKLRWRGMFSMTAAGQIDRMAMAQANEERYYMDPSDETANYSAGFNYNRLNYPRKALQVLEHFDARYDADVDISWDENQMALAYNFLGMYDSTLALVKSYDLPKRHLELATHHLLALVKLDSIERCFESIQNYNRQGVYNRFGEKAPFSRLYWYLCNFLNLQDHQEALTRAVRLLKEAAEVQSDSKEYPLIMGRAAYHMGDYEEAKQWWEKWDISNAPDDFDNYWTQIGIIHALTDGDAQADSILARPLEEIWYHDRARILCALGRKTEAFAMLKKAHDNGYFFAVGRYQYDIFLKPLFEMPEFQALVKPKG